MGGMRLRSATASVLALAALCAVTASAAPAKPLQGVKLAKCSKATRAAAFVAGMRTIDEAERMWMRFTLHERLAPRRGYEEVNAPGLSTWRKSRPGVKRFRYRQRVRALSEAAAYRMYVEFRWYDADGELLRQVVRRSRRCRQPGRLPNLQVGRIDRRDDGRYYVLVHNSGRAVASGASVQLFVDDFDAGTLPLGDVAVRKSRWAGPFDGPPCIGSVQAVADPASLVRESAEDDNAATAPCISLARG